MDPAEGRDGRGARWPASRRARRRADPDARAGAETALDGAGSDGVHLRGGHPDTVGHEQPDSSEDAGRPAPEPSTAGRPGGAVDDADPDGDRPDHRTVSFQQLIDQSLAGMVIVDEDHRVLLHNDEAARLLGTHHEDLVNARFPLPNRDEAYDVVRRDLDGVAHTLRIECAAFHGFERSAWTISIRDTAGSPDPADADRFGSSTHDALTGLPGRELLLNHLFEAARRSRAADEHRFAVVVIDLEHFVRINDDHGRAAGDRVLRAVATRLTSSVRPGDFVSRCGGDEFGVVLAAQPLAAHLAIADRIAAVLLQPITVDGTDLHCAPVISLAEHVASDDEHSVLDRAEETLIDGAPGRTRVAARPTDRDATYGGHLGATLNRAVSEGQMFLNYQPMFAVEDNALTGLEALVRWDHPDDGLVAPEEFIRIAEESGGIVPLGAWVVAEVCEQIAAWRADLPDYLVPPVSINVSARQLGSTELRRHTLEQLAHHGLGPEVLRFEITEEALLDRDPRVESLLRLLAADGIGLVLDDFGTGLASLSRLHGAPLVGLKIDRTFVSRMMDDERSAQLVLAAVGVGQAFDVPVTAIGVETVEQKAVLARWRCEHAQGYLLARPMNPVEASRFFVRDPASLRVRPSGPLLRSSGSFDRPLV